MEDSNKSSLLYIGLPLALGLILCGYFIGQTMYNAKVALNIAEVRGLAERKVNANSATWVISYSVASKLKSQLPSLYKKAEVNKQEIIKLLKENKINESEITIGPLDYNYMDYRDENQKVVDEVHSLKGLIEINTDQVKLIAPLRSKISRLIAKGIELRSYNPVYRFTKLNEIKPDMLREATQNARAAASEFAKNAGVKVGSIRSARQGNFSIKDYGEDYGDTKKIQKNVRVVTRIEFYLK